LFLTKRMAIIHFVPKIAIINLKGQVKLYLAQTLNAVILFTDLGVVHPYLTIVLDLARLVLITKNIQNGQQDIATGARK